MVSIPGMFEENEQYELIPGDEEHWHIRIKEGEFIESVISFGNIDINAKHEIMDYLEMKPKTFYKLCDKFRSPHLWKKVKSDWRLRHTVNKDGVDD